MCAVSSQAYSVATVAAYVQGEGRLALCLAVWSGCVYVCLDLEPGAVRPGHHPKDQRQTRRLTLTQAEKCGTVARSLYRVKKSYRSIYVTDPSSYLLLEQ